ncbi:MAG: PH domain-containing protein [Phycisphaerales bacterium]|nr:PH domain-containing protein [Phycisphaerales bacterium]
MSVHGDKACSRGAADPSLSSEATSVAERHEARTLPARLLDDGELVILMLRPHPLFVLLHPLGSLTGLAVLTVVAWWIIRLSPTGPGGGLMLTVGGSLILLRLIWSCLEWYNRVYVLTDRRVIRRRGVLRVSLFQAPLRRIQHLTMYFSIRERLFGIGTIGFATAGTGIPEAYWVMVRQPLTVHRRIQETIDKYAGHVGDAS